MHLGSSTFLADPFLTGGLKARNMTAQQSESASDALNRPSKFQALKGLDTSGERHHNNRFIALMDQHLPHMRVQRIVSNSFPFSHEHWKY